MGELFKRPFLPIGNRLRALREKQGESIDDVSGAVEIQPKLLEKIERGETRPTEELLMLLISHFDPTEGETVKLWELAGYSSDIDEPSTNLGHTMVVMPMDVRIVYSDSVQVSSNNFGVVMNFMQSAGQNNQPLAIARVGMSREHAESVLDVLKSALEAQKKQGTQQKLLGPTQDTSSSTKKQ